MNWLARVFRHVLGQNKDLHVVGSTAWLAEQEAKRQEYIAWCATQTALVCPNLIRVVIVEG